MLKKPFHTRLHKHEHNMIYYNLQHIKASNTVGSQLAPPLFFIIAVLCLILISPIIESRLSGSLKTYQSFYY